MSATEKYRPSNGTEGIIFYEEWCCNCQREQAHLDDPAYPDGAEGCEIFSRTLAIDIADADYPIEWVRDDKGCGICTAFRKIELGEAQDPNAAVADLFEVKP